KEGIDQRKGQNYWFKMDGKTRRWPKPINGLVGKLKQATVESIPKYLIHIAEIKSGGFKRIVAKYSLMTHLQGIYKHDQRQQAAGCPLLCTCIKSFHRGLNHNYRLPDANTDQNHK